MASKAFIFVLLTAYVISLFRLASSARFTAPSSMALSKRKAAVAPVPSSMQPSPPEEGARASAMRRSGAEQGLSSKSSSTSAFSADATDAMESQSLALAGDDYASSSLVQTGGAIGEKCCMITTGSLRVFPDGGGTTYDEHHKPIGMSRVNSVDVGNLPNALIGHALCKQHAYLNYECQPKRYSWGEQGGIARKNGGDAGEFDRMDLSIVAVDTISAEHCQRSSVGFCDDVKTWLKYQPEPVFNLPLELTDDERASIDGYAEVMRRHQKMAEESRVPLELTDDERASIDGYAEVMRRHQKVAEESRVPLELTDDERASMDDHARQKQGNPDPDASSSLVQTGGAIGAHSP